MNSVYLATGSAGTSLTQKETEVRLLGCLTTSEQGLSSSCLGHFHSFRFHDVVGTMLCFLLVKFTGAHTFSWHPCMIGLHLWQSPQSYPKRKHSSDGWTSLCK
jgi:hypothetical protein